MNRFRRLGKIALILATAMASAQVAASVCARTPAVHQFLAANLQKAFGRPVNVKHFNIQILPTPRIYGAEVTVNDDPAFGYEFFLRAEKLTATIRLLGLLRGRFELGTLSLQQPTLTIVRNREGRWNLEDWLPPARKSFEAAPGNFHGTSQATPVVRQLRRIEVDDGRIDFTFGEVKMPYALTNVRGHVEQISAGRWRLQLEAQPWRSGVALQSAGLISANGDLAGTSARLQPATLTIQWARASLADVFRLASGSDYGVRGEFSLRGTAKSASGSALADSLSTEITDTSGTNDWFFSVHAAASQIHRWDLTERTDNPSLTAKIDGRWNVALKKIVAEQFSVETESSNIHGSGELGAKPSHFVALKVQSAGIQAAELLSWYRAFRPEVAEKISADAYFTGHADVRGWPLKFAQAEFSTTGGVAKIVGVEDAIKISAFRGTIDQDQLAANSILLTLVNVPATPASALLASFVGREGERPASDSNSQATLSVRHDFSTGAGSLGIQGAVARTESVLKTASAFGKTMNRGWELSGPMRADLQAEWRPGSRALWNGSLETNDAEIVAAGLNQPIKLQQARLEWRDGKRSAQIVKAEALGGTWSGTVDEDPRPVEADQPGTWNVQLHANHLDAADLDRWIGPRARPRWLENLLPGLLSGPSDSSTNPSTELMRRLNVTGNVSIDEFAIDKIKLQQMRAHGSLHDLFLNITDGRAKWAGGAIHATLDARFRRRPVYDVAAQVDGIDLAQLPANWSTHKATGVASGTFRVRTAGVGQAELLEKLAGIGEVHLANFEFRGFDVNRPGAEPQTGASRWISGDGGFSLRDRKITLEGVRLIDPTQTTFVRGTVSFSREANISVETGRTIPSLHDSAPPPQILKIVGPLDGPRISRDKSTPRQPAD